MVRSFLLAGLLGLAGLAQADTVVTDIRGVDGAVLDNVRAHLGLVRAERLDEVSAWRLRQMSGDAREEVRQALRPFGYYRPRIDVRLEEPETDGAPWRAMIRIETRDPVTIGEVVIDIQGDAARDPAFDEWRSEWPLPTGSRLIHADYETAWRNLSRLAESRGYYDARFVERFVEVDTDRNRARVELIFDSGPRYSFGRFSAPDAGFSDRLMRRLTIVEPGEPFTSSRLDEQRDTLVRSGLFQQVAVDEQRDAEQATVNLVYDLERRRPNSYRATVGFGTDTGGRIQLNYDRHYLSSRGNSLNSGFGIQERNNEFVLRSEYLHPRGRRPFDFLTAGIVLRREQDNFRFRDSDRESVFDSFSGRREQAELTLGRRQNRNILRERFGATEERLFLAILNESFDAFREARFSEENEALLAAHPELGGFLSTETNTQALGARWRVPNISGSGFFAEGEVIEAQLLGASESLGSDVGFAQAYLSARWHRIFGDRHKLLLKGEAGYTEASTRELDLSLDERNLELSLTELPERYRFKTGGDRTIRGYGFETLSTNRNGANHILAASFEYEYRVGENWSLAGFFDIGNAFNDFSKPRLKRGVGAGFRWYTLIGPIQVDVAQALDDVDQPWRLHFTIGTRLL